MKLLKSRLLLFTACFFVMQNTYSAPDVEQNPLRGTGSCGDSYDKEVENYLNNVVDKVCDAIDTTNKPENSIAYYLDPNVTGGCDIGLNMPGLPSLSDMEFSVTGPDACDAVKMITKDTVDTVNNNLLDKLSGVLNNINEQSKTLYDIDLTDIANNAMDEANQHF